MLGGQSTVLKMMEFEPFFQKMELNVISFMERHKGLYTVYVMFSAPLSVVHTQ
jgi:hypothetical protein